MTGKSWERVNFHQYPRYQWLIPTGTQTLTHGRRKCAMDRIIVGEQFLPAVVPESAGVNQYDSKGMYMLGGVRARTISDHYPVQLELFVRPLPATQHSWSSSLGSWRSMLPNFLRVSINAGEANGEQELQQIDDDIAADIDVNGLPADDNSEQQPPEERAVSERRQPAPKMVSQLLQRDESEVFGDFWADFDRMRRD